MVRGGGNGVVDDLSSQGSYMVKVGGMGNQRSNSQNEGFTDMQSEGSFMARGPNAQNGSKPIFDEDSEGSMIR